uniref:DUF1279 domain-containing protein n=2 Tax=Magallana gigas TaxID=29159 RepID=A0A8W8P515_MAGGI|nr:protein FAM210B, mitochondrial-like [Crassostrea gigas]
MNQLSKCLSRNYGVSFRSQYGLLTRSEFVLRNSTSQIHNPLQWDLTLKLGSHHGKRCLHIAASAQLPGSRDGTPHNLPSLDQSLAISKKLTLSQIHSCRQFSSSSFLLCERKDSGDNKSAKSSSSGGSESTGDVEVKLTQRQRLKRAVKEYGPVVIVFHICIALISLGFFYSLVSMGVDVIGILRKLGVSEKILESGLATGASTFVVAYAVHKLFAVPRIGITLTCAPMIVHKLRKLGVFKPPKP